MVAAFSEVSRLVNGGTGDRGTVNIPFRVRVLPPGMTWVWHPKYWAFLAVVAFWTSEALRKQRDPYIFRFHLGIWIRDLGGPRAGFKSNLNFWQYFIYAVRCVSNLGGFK